MDPRRQLELAESLERLAAERPRAYRLRVLGLAMLGYGVVVGMLALVVGALGLLVWAALSARGAVALAQLALPLGALAWIVARSLWVRPEPPAGREVTAAEMPMLMALVARVRAQLDAPSPHVVLLTPDLAATVAEVPRLGLLGPSRRYLTVGLPLAAALTPAQLESVLAHELAHLSRRHARPSHRAWRLTRVWTRLLESLVQERRWGTQPLERFFAWYAPYFETYTAVLSRQAELEADHLAAEATSARATAEALVTLAVATRFIDDAYWPAVYRATHNDPTPPDSAFSDLLRAMRGVRTLDGADTWMREALVETTRAGASHPALRERLAALGVPVATISAAALPESQTAASIVLGERVAAMTADLDAVWREGVRDAWRAQHRTLREARERRARLGERARAGAMTADEAWTLARETLELDGEEAALPLLRDIVARDPEYAAASFTLGRLMLARGDDGGLPLLERAARVDPQAMLAACELADEFLMRRGRRDEALAWQERASAHRQLLERAQREREGVERRDTIAPLALGASDLERLRTAFAASPEVTRARVARKVTAMLPDRPFVLVAIEREAPWWKPRARDADRRLLGAVLERVSLDFDCDLWMVVLDGETRWLGKKLDEVGAGAVYERT